MIINKKKKICNADTFMFLIETRLYIEIDTYK